MRYFGKAVKIAAVLGAQPPNPGWLPVTGDAPQTRCLLQLSIAEGSSAKTFSCRKR